MNAQVIAEHLGGKKQGNGYICRCPIHDDKTPSLQVTDTTDGKILIFCHAKCSAVDVIGYLKRNELWPEIKPKNIPRKIVATYPYTDASGKLLFEVIRYSPKGFAQRRPDPANSSKWIYNLIGVPHVPFRLPRVLNAIDNGKMIFICEGEKDVLNLETIGLTATCNSKGAGNWREEHSEYVKNSKVVIIPDNDDSGINHARTIIKTLRNYASSIKILNLPNVPLKGDVSDWIKLNKG